MRSRNTDHVNFDEVNSAVGKLLNSGVPLKDIRLRMIQALIDDRGSLSTISKYFETIKRRLERGEAIDGTQLSDTDIEELRALVDTMIERRTLVVRKEKDDSAQAMSDLMQQFEIDKSEKAEIIDDLDRQVLALQEERDARTVEIDNLKSQILRLDGMVEALNGTITVLVPSTVAPLASGPGDQMPELKPAEVVEQEHPAMGQAEMQLINVEEVDKPNGGGHKMV